MQTHIEKSIRDSPQGRSAEQILRKCVHCGFCNATCPTYQLLGDELDGPRGRIYLMKQMLEGHGVSRKTQQHLDRCLTCLSCRTTCPSGVDYGKLLDIGRALIEERVDRPLAERLSRRLLARILPYPSRFLPLLRTAQLLRPLSPNRLKNKIPKRQPKQLGLKPRHPRKMVILEGCVQPSLCPTINATTERLLDSLGISLIRAPDAGCCGAINHHLGDPDKAYDFMKKNIDAWWPHVEAGAEVIVTTASGCGVVVKEYGELLAHDPEYQEKASRIAAMTKDISEIIRHEDLPKLPDAAAQKIAFHSPCTLQHGQKLNGVVEAILTEVGYELTPVQDAHLCCGSAGTYSILQADLSQRLLANKLETLETNSPTVIATANIGCQLHLQTKANVPVLHWIELLATPLQKAFR